MANVKQLVDRFTDRLSELMGQRACFGGKMVQDELFEGYPEFAWVVSERKEMLEMVNAERQKIDRPPISLKDVFRVENMALGHSDYARKFALYCAELVLRDPEEVEP